MLTSCSIDSTDKKVKEILIKQLLINDESLLVPESRFIEDLGADSLDTLELVLTLEKEFKISISDEDVETMLTIQNVVDKINELLDLK